MEVARKVLVKIWWLGKGTATVMGIAVILAMVLGIGTAAMAAVPGDPFRLGQTNVINNAITSLVGSRAGGAVMLVDNNSGAAGSRALDLRSEAGRAPLTVNPGSGKAPNLDADRLDGKDSSQLFSGETYPAFDRAPGVGGGGFVSASARCDAEDPVLGGGIRIGGSLDNQLVQSGPQPPSISEVGNEWRATIQDNGASSAIDAIAICADFPPLRNP